jgi:5-methylcytosine-specific restriction endonuclease McrA
MKVQFLHFAKENMIDTLSQNDLVDSIFVPKSEKQLAYITSWISQRYQPDCGEEYSKALATQIKLHFVRSHWLETRLSTLKQSYLSFLKSSRWEDIKRQVRQRYNYQCAFCGNDDYSSLECHHTDYGKGWDDIASILLLCSNCHRGLHSTK